MITTGIDVSRIKGFKTLSHIFSIEGYEVRLTSNCIHYILKNRTPPDYELSTNATLEDIKSILEVSSWNIINSIETHSMIDIASGDVKFKLKYSSNFREDSIDAYGLLYE